MAADPFSNPGSQEISITDSDVDDNQIAVAGNDAYQYNSNAHNNKGVVNNFFQSIVTTALLPFEYVKSAFHWFQDLSYENEESHLSSLIKRREIEDTIRNIQELSNHTGDIAQETQRVADLTEEKIRQDWLIFEENTRVVKELQSRELEYKREELQSESNRHYLPFQVEIKDIHGILEEERGNFVIIPSPPEISVENSVFKSLNREISSALSKVVSTYYADLPVGYTSIFKNSVEDAQAKTVGKYLSSTPTIIFNSEVAHQKLFVSVTVTCPKPSVFLDAQNYQGSAATDSHQKQFELEPLNWFELKKSIESEGANAHDVNQKVLDFISIVHAVVAASFADLYCLSLNPFHSPKLSELVEASQFSDVLKTWTQPLQNYLDEAQNQAQQSFLQDNYGHQVEGQFSQGTTYTDIGELLKIGCTIVAFIAFGIFGLSVISSLPSPPPLISDSSTQINSNAWIVSVPGGNYANFRSSPEIRYDNVIGQLQSGTLVVVGDLSSDRRWRWVRAEDGSEGWIASNFAVERT